MVFLRLVFYISGILWNTKNRHSFNNGKSSKFIYVKIRKIIPLISHTTYYAFSSPLQKKYESTNLYFSLSLVKCHWKYNNRTSNNFKMDDPLNPFRIKNEMMKYISTKMQLPQSQWITQTGFHGFSLSVNGVHTDPTI